MAGQCLDGIAEMNGMNKHALREIFDVVHLIRAPFCNICQMLIYQLQKGLHNLFLARNNMPGQFDGCCCAHKIKLLRFVRLLFNSGQKLFGTGQPAVANENIKEFIIKLLHLA